MVVDALGATGGRHECCPALAAWLHTYNHHRDQTAPAGN
jgi:hypothetical protein